LTSRIEREILELHARLCRTLAHPVRLAILNALREGEHGVGELTELVQVPQPTVSQHLAVLRNQGLLRKRRNGNEVFYRIAYPKMIQACDLLREVLFEHLREQERLVVAEVERGAEAGEELDESRKENVDMAQVEGFLGRDFLIPEDRYYDAGEHFWLKSGGEDPGEVLIGVTSPGVALTGGLVELEMFPEEGDHVEAGQEVAFSTTKKNIKYFVAPVAGQVAAVNREVTAEDVNEEPYDLWLLRIQPQAGWEAFLVGAGEYAALLARSEHATEAAAKSAGGKGSPTCKSLYSGIKEP